MIFYVGVFATIILMRFAMGEYARTNPRIYQVMMVVLFLISAFRYDVGCDWGGYLVHYEEQKAGTFATAFAKREWLWYVLLEIVDLTGLAYEWVNVLTSLAFFAGIHVFARRQPDRVGYLVFLFPILIMNLPMSGIRQGVSVGLMCIALCSFLDRRVVSFVIWTLIAGSIHTSAFMFLMLVPFCLNLKPSVQFAAAAVLAVPGLYFMLTGSAADVAFSRYVQSDTEAAGATYRVALVFATGAVFLFLFRRAWFQLYPHDFMLMLLGSMLMLVCGALLLLSSVIADRVGFYLIPIQAAILARIPFLPIRSGRPLFFLAPYAVFLGVFVAYTAMSTLFQLCYVPYRTWLFG